MKVFLIFLVVSFTLGVTLQEETTQKRRWATAGMVAALTVIYFFFDRFI